MSQAGRGEQEQLVEEKQDAVVKWSSQRCCWVTGNYWLGDTR